MSIAEKMAANQKQVAISEFFEKNKHFLGFDTLNRALITAVKEAVDNALDACEEARILPDIVVKITKLDNKKDILQLEVEDNGPATPDVEPVMDSTSDKPPAVHSFFLQFYFQ